ncbi:hypothetical protein BT93_E0832 [Corymbia citriodora subsp. variegata]|nr:hypothetical protein BT93_E0832 [Corymbia citriodora subsp. variegata]
MISSASGHFRNFAQTRVSCSSTGPRRRSPSSKSTRSIGSSSSSPLGISSCSKEREFRSVPILRRLRRRRRPQVFARFASKSPPPPTESTREPEPVGGREVREVVWLLAAWLREVGGGGAMAEAIGPRLYSCWHCRNHVALHDDVISKSFQILDNCSFL